MNLVADAVRVETEAHLVARNAFAGREVVVAQGDGPGGDAVQNLKRGIALGSARGGVLVGLAERFGLPVHAIGVGESIDDLQPFEAETFARALMGLAPR